MTEAEIIRQMKASMPKKGFNMTNQQLIALEKRTYDKAYHEAYIDALHDANSLIILISCMYMMDNFHCKEEGLKKFIQYFEHMNDLYGQGQYTLKNLADTIHEETGLEIVSDTKNKYAKKALERC